MASNKPPVIRYPSILLRRKKEFEPATWAPQPALGRRRTLRRSGPDDRAGTGSITNPGGRSCRFCECYIRKFTATYNTELTRVA